MLKITDRGKIRLRHLQKSHCTHKVHLVNFLKWNLGFFEYSAG